VRSADWDARYAAAELVWGAEPNRFVAEVLGELPAGRALDVACGEGRNAIWLARLGWSVVGVDFSQVAVDRARELARRAGVAAVTRFLVRDLVADPLPPDAFDAVVIAYLHLQAGDRRRVLAGAAGRLATGGLLVVVGHDRTNISDGIGGPQDPAILLTPDDVAADLPSVMTVERAERVQRSVVTPDGDRVAIDTMVVARRSAE
jgi:SAM-dependent methyltransferase